MKKNFAITGVAGYIAPRHLKAIKDTGNDLVCALDPHDSVGVIDSHFPDASYFREFERFDRYVSKLAYEKAGMQIDYVTICSPNYLHDSHIRFALRVGAHAICEKPLVLNPWNCESLIDDEKRFDRRIYTVLQLRVHPRVIELREKILAAPKDKKWDVELTYITPRGKWYHFSWKGNASESGGLATNIGIHFFDLLVWLFGPVKSSELHHADDVRCSGVLELERARCPWFLSISRDDLETLKKQDGATLRCLTIEDETIDFSTGFADLHTKVYEDVLSGKGYGVKDAQPSIQIVHDLRHLTPGGLCSESHPAAKTILRG
ncbi:MAG: Gfo/Idh/MocA family oxidoreductase [Planctomycetes bacterium]|nr:Gfo/Idh/MocA family oxidoreductase [Planctomycetota bacterium]